MLLNLLGNWTLNKRVLLLIECGVDGDVQGVNWMMVLLLNLLGNRTLSKLLLLLLECAADLTAV